MGPMEPAFLTSSCLLHLPSLGSGRTAAPREQPRVGAGILPPWKLPAAIGQGKEKPLTLSRRAAAGSWPG